MALLVPYIALLFILKVASSHPAGFWPEYIEDDNNNLVDSSFEDDTTSTTVTSLDTARADSDATVTENEEADTTDGLTTTTTATAETTSAAQDSSATTIGEADSNNSITWSTTTVVADVTTEHQNLTLPPPSQQPPSDKPKKSWAEIFCEKVKQFFSYVGHKITDTSSFIQRLFHWLY